MKKIIALVISLMFVPSAFALDTVRSIGDKNAPVVIKEFASFTCPSCAKFHKDFYKKIKKEYIKTGKVRLEYYNFPLDSIALYVSAIALTAPKRNYFKFISYAFKNQADLRKNPKATLDKWASVAGVSVKKMKKIQNDSTLIKRIQAEQKTYTKKYNVNSTPTIYVNDKMFAGVPNEADFFQAIENAIKNKK